jgi:hypothetical protein
VSSFLRSGYDGRQAPADVRRGRGEGVHVAGDISDVSDIHDVRDICGVRATGCGVYDAEVKSKAFSNELPRDSESWSTCPCPPPTLGPSPGVYPRDMFRVPPLEGTACKGGQGGGEGGREMNMHTHTCKQTA